MSPTRIRSPPPWRWLQESPILAARSPKGDHRSTLLGRAGEPEEIGDAVVWLASPLATFVTGHILGVDGGLGIDMGEDIEGMARMIHGETVVDTALGTA
jgi:NAD(P)-dependent dehydrogenase (short-subunit alcohol dehydrogenase family)